MQLSVAQLSAQLARLTHAWFPAQPWNCVQQEDLRQLVQTSSAADGLHVVPPELVPPDVVVPEVPEVPDVPDVPPLVEPPLARPPKRPPFPLPPEVPPEVPLVPLVPLEPVPVVVLLQPASARVRAAKDARIALDLRMTKS